MRKVVGIVGAVATTLVLCASASAATPTVTEFGAGTGASAPSGIAAGPDGNLWFTSGLAAGEIGEMTPAGTVLGEYAIPTEPSLPRDIAAGPDERLWFTEQGGNKIGAITTGGTITEYPVTTPSSQPYGIAAGPDRKIWFTERNADKIGRIDTDGSNLVEFALPAGSDPRDIVAGPDGRLWFTMAGTDQIGRMTTLGTLVTSPAINLPAGSDPESITPGTGASLWFTEKGADKIKQVSTGGLILDEYSLPAVSGNDAEPTGIAIGQDGGIWFTEQGTNRIGRIEPDAFVPLTHYYSGITEAGFLQAIAPGADGNLWFTEADNNAVGRITTLLDPPALENPAPLQIPGGAASTYPSTIEVAGLEGPIADVRVRLTGLSHTWPDDVEVLLVAPTGQRVLLAADNGGGGDGTNEVGTPVTGVTLNLSDAASAGSVPNNGPLVSGIFNVGQGNSNGSTSIEFPAPAPESPYSSFLSAFDGQNANGTWKLFVNDDFASADNGFIHGGWGLDVITRGAYDDGPFQFTEDDGNLRMNVLSNDTGGFLQIDEITEPAHGTAAIIVDDPFELSYQPDPDYCNEPGPAPPDTLQYTITGGDTATVTIDVICTPDPSVANDDTRTVAEDSGATAFTVLSNDTDADDEPVQITAASDPANGTATVIQGTPDTMSYSPNANYCNDGAPPDDTFTYTVGGGDTATVSVAVTCLDEPPLPPGPTPQTTITKGPKKKLKAKKKATAKFEFSSSVSGSTFTCSLDGAAPSGCTSPKTYKVKKGKHSFSVTATAAGQKDPTPATFSFEVKKKKRKK